MVRLMFMKLSGVVTWWDHQAVRLPQTRRPVPNALNTVTMPLAFKLFTSDAASSRGRVESHVRTEDAIHRSVGRRPPIAILQVLICYCPRYPLRIQGRIAF